MKNFRFLRVARQTSNIKSDHSKVNSAIQNAIICQNRELTTGFRYISEMRACTQTCKDKKVLILGAGYVSAPVVDYLSSKGHHVTLVSSVQNESAAMVDKYNFQNVEPMTFDCLKETEELTKLIKSHDLVISLLPYVFHAQVAEIAINNDTNMVTASYLTDGMVALDQKSKDRGITVVNEVGVDPGIDHMLAMELFDELKEGGENVKSFVSFCGGLPAPEASSNPLGYKFSWSPRGVLLNTVSGAKWLHENQVDEIHAGGDIINKPYNFSALKSTDVPFTTWNGYSLEGLPNRDSTKYREPYCIPKCETLLRGTFRYSGYCSVLRDLHALKLIDETANECLNNSTTWSEFISKITKCPTGATLSGHISTMKNAVGDSVNVKKLASLGLFSDEPIKNKLSPLDALANLLDGKMQYGEGEKDAIIMRHEVVTHEHPDTVHGVDFIFYGDQGSKNGKEYSAMAQTVGYPCAIAAHLVLEGVINKPGMVTPITKDIYEPILAELTSMGIVAKRTLN